jgi:hypothetical protein
MDKNASRELSRVEIIFAFLGVAILIIPLVLVTVFGDNEYIQLVLGGWRIFLFWGIAIPSCYFLEKKLNPEIRRFWPTIDVDR